MVTRSVNFVTKSSSQRRQQRRVTTSRTSKSRSSKSRTSSHSAKSTAPVRYTIITIIILAIISVIIGLITALFFNTEKLVKRQLDTFAAEYYEGYLYKHLVHGAMTKDEISTLMQKYATRGFPEVNLRQLLLYDRKSTDETSLIKEHCDTNTTSVTFYPIAPFDKHSYRYEYSYDCDF